uniref:Secreted protein n=1 Tax=Stegastes partitus TaxID=144197 RepID=A0A3B5ACW3_9TELE
MMLPLIALMVAALSAEVQTTISLKSTFHRQGTDQVLKALPYCSRFQISASSSVLLPVMLAHTSEGFHLCRKAFCRTHTQPIRTKKQFFS